MRAASLANSTNPSRASIHEGKIRDLLPAAMLHFIHAGAVYMFFGLGPVWTLPLVHIDHVLDALDKGGVIQIAVCHSRSHRRSDTSRHGSCDASEGNRTGTTTELGEQLLRPVPDGY